MATFAQFIKNPVKYAREIDNKKLETYLRKLSKLYYNTSESPISDKLFDELKDILQEVDPDNPFLSEVGAPITRNKVKLPYPMGSLDKIKPDTSDIDKWIQTYHGPYELSDKLDGISAMLHKKNNELKLYSRGDGKIGQDITHLLKYIDVDASDMPNNSAIRGELIMSKKNFKKIKNVMKNARNAVAGVVNSKTVDTKMAGMVEFITYNILYPRLLQEEQYTKLEEWGFYVVHHKEVSKISIDKLLEYFAKRREVSDYEIDGIVVMDNNMVYNVVEGNPKYGFAFKSIMKDQYTTATVIDVEWAISRHNYIKPRIKIDPINLVGVTITYATAHNAKFIYDNKIGIGSKIKIIRSGDVIPKIMEVLTPAKNNKPKMPDIPYEWTDTGVDIVVKNASAESKSITIVKQLVNTTKTLDVKFIDEGLMTKLVENGYDTFIKIIRAERADITDIIGSKMTEKIFEGINYALKHTQLHILMASSNYFGRGMGVRKLQIVTKQYPNIMNENWTEQKLYDNINSLDGFQDKTTQKFVDGFGQFKKYFDKINKYIDIEYLRKPQKTKMGDLFVGQKIVMTGFRDSDMVEFIEKNQGEVTGSVSKNTTLVVCADDSGTSSKLQNAHKLKIPIMTKDKFIKKFIN